MKVVRIAAEVVVAMTLVLVMNTVSFLSAFVFVLSVVVAAASSSLFSGATKCSS